MIYRCINHQCLQPISGKMYLRSEGAEIEKRWLDRYCELYGQYANAFDEILRREDDDDDTPLQPPPPHPPTSPSPLKVFPHVTAVCIRDSRYCYHTLYNTHDTSTSKCYLFLVVTSNLLLFVLLCMYAMFLISNLLCYRCTSIQLHHFSDIARQNRCCSSSTCVCQAPGCSLVRSACTE